MNKKLSEALKVDMGIAPVSVAHGNIAISRLFPLGPKQRKALFCVCISSADLNNAQTIDVGIVDDTVATPAATTNLATRDAADETLAYRRITSPAAERVTAMRVDMTAAADGAITINGTVFPYAAIPATDLEWDDDAAFVTAVNGAGLGITAAALGGNVVTLVSTTPGETVIEYSDTVAAIAATDVLINQMQVIMEADMSEMDIENAATGVYGVYDHLAGAGTCVVSGTLVRGDGRYTPEQAVVDAL